MKTFASFDALRAAVGTDVAVTQWLTITQERIDRFAEATDDHQWIHVDAERAALGPFGRPIAHGFLTLSLLSRWLAEAVQVQGVRLSINYGTDRVRFTAPVPVGSRLRAHLHLLSLQPIEPDGVHLCWRATVEIEGQAKPACVADMLVRHYR
ncbi:MaoC family dehydratase [Tepidimonas sp.]|uniref:MaoC family dehydratase n=1 Tax=Tepidimonas sp. TaxID=2002775 RepID=UPI002FE309F7